MEELLAAPLGALIIFGLRIVDVSMGTVRMILGVRGFRAQAGAIGFVEVLIWLVAVGAALQHLTSIPHIVGYAGGFAAGNYVGIWLESRFALGTSVVRATFREGGNGDTPRSLQAAKALRAAGFAVTELTGRGRDRPVQILNVVTQRRQVDDVMHLIQSHDADAFVTVEEVRATRNGYFRPAPRWSLWPRHRL